MAASPTVSRKPMSTLKPASGFGNDLGNGYVEVMPDEGSDDDEPGTNANDQLYKEFSAVTEHDAEASFEGIMDEVLSIEAASEGNAPRRKLTVRKKSAVHNGGPISVLPREGSDGDNLLKTDLAKLKAMLTAGEINDNTYASACDRAIMVANITDLLETGKITGHIYTQALIAALGNSTAANKYASGAVTDSASASEA